MEEKMAIIRLDKMLSNCGIGSRKKVKELFKLKKVSVDGKTVDKSDIKIDTEKNVVCLDGRVISYKKYIYLIMNKPAGIISATEDNKEKTVIDILPDEYKRFNVFPVGRLDKDTVGMLILTNDGEFAHNTLSPKKHIIKKYFAIVSGIVDDNDIKIFSNGIKFMNGEVFKSAKLEVCGVNEGKSNVFIEISEGKFHQIKRMFKFVGKEVLLLKRIKFGGLTLDEKLKEGEVRELTEKELEMIFQKDLVKTLGSAQTQFFL